MTRDAELKARDFVALVLSNIGAETDAFGVADPVARHGGCATPPGDPAACGARERVRLLETPAAEQPPAPRSSRRSRPRRTCNRALTNLGTLDGLDLKASRSTPTYAGRWCTSSPRPGAQNCARSTPSSKRDDADPPGAGSHPRRTPPPRPRQDVGAGDGPRRRTNRTPPPAWSSPSSTGPGQDAHAVHQPLPRCINDHLDMGTHEASTALEFVPRPLASPMLEKVDASLETSTANPGAVGTSEVAPITRSWPGRRRGLTALLNTNAPSRWRRAR